jgi:ATP-dependent RNA helicase DeaD
MKNFVFKDLNLSEEVKKALAERGFEKPTPIQFQSIPHILKGNDIIGQAQTGTGKTCAFGIPAIEKIDAENGNIQTLVLCPTRELAIQTTKELKSVAKYKKGIKILAIYGGEPIGRQITALRQHPQIIIGTPGRVMDHMRRGTLNFRNLRMIILDEADEMLNMGFREDIDTILKQIPTQRQTLFFSATMPKEIRELTVKYQKEPILIQVVREELTVPSIDQFYLEVKNSAKPEVLSRLIDVYNIRLSLVFCNTKRKVKNLTSALQSRGYRVEALHGDLRQAQRDRVMDTFRRGNIDILIATDVAARGIDVDNIEAVFNYDLPVDEEYYVHRVGRTGRAGRSGKAFTFVSGREIHRLKKIQRYTKAPILPKKPPTSVDIEAKKVNNILEKVKTLISTDQLNEQMRSIEKMLSDSGVDYEKEKGQTNLKIAAALLKILMESTGNQGRQVKGCNETANSNANKGMVRLFINAGRDLKIQPKHIIDGFVAKTSLPKKLIGDINIYDRFAFAEVPHEYAPEVITVMKDYHMNGRRINVEKAHSR